MCTISINPASITAVPLGSGANSPTKITVDGTVTNCISNSVLVEVECAGQAPSRAQAVITGNAWTVTLQSKCPCASQVTITAVCKDSPPCTDTLNTTLTCTGGTGTGGGGTGGAGTNHCRPKWSVFGLSIVIRCQLVLLIMSIGWGTALGMFTFYLGLGPASQNSFGTGVMGTAIVAGAIALVATLIYLLFCRQCLCWFWLLIWRVLWLGGILAAWFRKPTCGPNCVITSYIGVVTMIVAIIVLFVWQRACNKTICAAGYEGILYTVAVFFPIVVPLLLWGFPQCTVPLGNTTYGPPWGFIVLGLAFVLFWAMMLIGQMNNSCPGYPPPEWDL
jgi:hypothetical protein